MEPGLRVCPLYHSGDAFAFATWPMIQAWCRFARRQDSVGAAPSTDHRQSDAHV